jgi:hypothetical protein
MKVRAETEPQVLLKRAEAPLVDRRRERSRSSGCPRPIDDGRTLELLPRELTEGAREAGDTRIDTTGPLASRSVSALWRG